MNHAFGVMAAWRPMPFRYEFKCAAALAALEIPLPLASRVALAQWSATAMAVHLTLVLEKPLHLLVELGGNGFRMLFAASHNENG
jgi:hypothetical protein